MKEITQFTPEERLSNFMPTEKTKSQFSEGKSEPTLTKIAPLFDPSKPNIAKVFEPQSGLLFWDEHLEVYYQQYKKLTGQFWVPHEVSLQTDAKDWVHKMSDKQKELFKRAVSQLVLLDSISSLIDGELASHIKNAAIKTLMFYLGSQETIHNESYTYICTSFMSKEEAKSVFERPKTDPKVLEATMPILEAFEDYRMNPTPETAAYALLAMSCLEGVRFTNGFTPFYYLNRSNLMQGTGSVINLINRDETQHSYTQIAIARNILTEYASVIDEGKVVNKVYDLFRKVVKAEQELSVSLYADFDDIDIVEVQMYIEWRANMLLANMGLEKIFETKRNPMKWIAVFDPENNNNQKSDFFEKRLTNYTKTDNKKQKWDDL